MIDPHVHCRDGKESYKETIKHVLALAEEQGIEKIFDMPNTDPPILEEKDVSDRLRLVPKKNKRNYYIYMAVTSGEEQIKEAVRCYYKFREIIGLKLYAGPSTRNLGVEENKIQQVYKTLASLSYDGVLAVHCEKESMFKPELYDSVRPITHSYVRPEEAEFESIKEQIYYSIESGFAGTLHICHISSPKSVEIVDDARKKLKITCGVTPHHVMWHCEMLHGPDDWIYKTNPPLRSGRNVIELRKHLQEGKIDWIETDHAPYAHGEKIFIPGKSDYPSGFPSMYLYSYFVEEYLPRIGASKELIGKMTYLNIMKAFGSKLKE
ncbi:MAG TPA: dihydroorotase [Candidatus Nanoarchaeia archaeon]|nr:dihydroorotase [Candidatus Nanoarchaeia archaeon]